MYLGEQGYLYLLDDTLGNGQLRPSRVGNTYSRFAPDNLVFDLRNGFPIITTRKIFWRPVIGELAAFLQGADHVDKFVDQGCNYWNDDAKRWGKNGYLGRIYGVQWRNWNNRHDQLRELIKTLVMDPFGRRHIVSAWNPSDLHDMALPPCHILFQVYARPEEKALDMMVYMRSVDLCLGLPSDLVLYGALLHLIAKEVRLNASKLTFQFGDAHIYANHAEQAQMQIARAMSAKPPPAWECGPSSLFDFRPDEVKLVNYQHEETISYKLNYLEVLP